MFLTGFILAGVCAFSALLSCASKVLLTNSRQLMNNSGAANQLFTLFIMSFIFLIFLSVNYWEHHFVSNHTLFAYQLMKEDDRSYLRRSLYIKYSPSVKQYLQNLHLQFPDMIC